MANVDLQECAMLEGASNFVRWKCKMQNLVEEVELCYLVDKEVTPPVDSKDLVEHTKKLAKVKQIVLDSLKDQLIPCITEKRTVKEMFDALIMLYQSVNLSRKILLKNKLNGTCMRKTDIVASYVMKIIELRDQLAAIG